MVPKGHLHLWRDQYCEDISTFVPKHFTHEVSKITSEFVWNHKPPKVKRTAILKSKGKGGLDMKDFVIFDKALKQNWVKRLCSSDHLDAP